LLITRTEQPKNCSVQGYSKIVDQNRIKFPYLPTNAVLFEWSGSVSVIEQIKADQIAARKQKLTAVASLLTTLIGEAEMVGKNAGRAVTDAEVVQMIKKFIKNIDETIRALGDADPRTAVALAEKTTLEKYLPQQLDEAALRSEIGGIVAGLQATGVDNPTVGDVMKFLKLRFDGKYDGRLASTIIKEFV
jgi:uncharacterized protein YqeY